jgi:hypothetical protein
MMEFEEPLSLGGHARRTEILGVAKQAARTRRVRRRTGQAAIVACSLMLLATLITRMPTRSMQPDNQANLQPISASPAAIPIERIPTDPTIADRLSVTPSAHWQQINDDDLIQSLANAGQSVGLVQMSGQTILLTPPDEDQKSDE